VVSDIDCGRICPEFYFDAVEALPPIGMGVVAQSPVNIVVADSDGRRVGFDRPAEVVVNEIPGATYSGPRTWPQTIEIPAASPEQYRLLIFGTEAGDFQVTIETVSEGGFLTRGHQH
jgi:hypothetical protein